jgi:hypothetical protein
LERGWERSLWLVVPRVVGGTTHLKISNVYAASVSESVSGALQVAMNSPRITYTPRPDATPEGELSALSAVYKFILDCHERKKAARPGRPVSAKGGSSDSSARPIIPEPS